MNLYNIDTISQQKKAGGIFMSKNGRKEVKKMQAEAAIKFRDLKADKIREPGEMFTVSKERFRELEERGFVKEAEKKKTAEPEEKEACSSPD